MHVTDRLFALAMLYYNHQERGEMNMEKKIKLSTLSAAIESACNNLRTNYSFTDEQCMEFVANFMENLARDGWKIVEG